MAMANRPASFLPTIKCSSCSREIEISMMGEHICGKAADEPAPPPPPANFDQFMSYGKGNNSSSATNNGSNYGYDSKEQDRPSRVPPLVDTSAANRSYYRTGQLTPVSNSSGSQSVSPKTPVGIRNGGMGGGGGGGGRGGGGGNDFFEPKIAGEFDSPSSSSQQQRRPGGYGGLGGGGADDGLMDAYPPPPSGSPKRQPQTNLLQRMNTIAPGPFDVSRRPSAGNARNAFPSRQNNAAANNSDDEFQPPAFNRAGTFPRLSESAEPPSRTPSAPGPRPDRNRRQPSNATNYYNNNHNNNGSINNSPPSTRARRPSMGPDTSRPPPPRTSLLRPRTSGRDGSSDSSNYNNSIPQINLAAEFGIGNPYHSASDSMSSTVSSVLSRPGIPFSSSASSFSSASSSSTSNSLSNRDQQRSKVNNNNGADFDSLMNDLQSMKPSDERPDRSTQNDRGRTGGYGGFGGNSSNSSSSSSRPKSPLVSPVWNNSSNSSNTASLRTRTSPDRRPQSRGRGMGMRGGDSDNNGGYRSGSLRREPSRARAPAPPPMPASRGSCKACGELIITGKSVASADGRLTGRYHKACFVCTTCAEPFASSTFYVHDDQPYCERHYHAVNGSLCGSCGDGIEGAYLADEADSKFHRRCFVCADCQLPLEDGYFEVAGAVYCERDASKRVQQTWLSQSLPTPMSSSSLSSPRGGGGGMGNSLMVPRGGLPSGPGGGGGGLPSGPGVSRRPSMGLPNPNALGSAARPFGLPSGNRLGPRPRMEKRMTRLGMM